MPGGVRWWKYNQGWRETEFLLVVSGCWPKKASIVEPACFVSLKAFVHMFVCKHLLATAVAMLLPHCCLSKDSESMWYDCRTVFHCLFAEKVQA